MDGMIEPTIKVEQYGIDFDVLKKIPHPDYEVKILKNY
jgi:hypothetical protein